MPGSIDDYLNDPETTEAEKALIAACQEGRSCVLNGGKLPAEGATEPSVRAALIRLLALEATSLHDRGVWLEGALITGHLDLSFARCRGMFALINCRFAEEPHMAQTELAHLSFDGSHLPGLFAKGARVTGSFFLRGVTATGTVDVNAAQIGGQLSCKGATLNGGGGMSLNSQLLKVTGSISLCGVRANGVVNVGGAEIGGQLDCVGADLNGGEGVALFAQRAKVAQGMFLSGVTAIGTMAFSDAQISGEIDCTGATMNGGGGKALDGQSLRVEGTFFFRRVKAAAGRVDLSSAAMRVLVDDAESWRKCSELILDGLTYDRIAGSNVPKTFAARKAWLEKGSRFKDEFLPQPYTQFAKVMRAAGHVAEARKALVERDRILFAEAEKADRAALGEALQADQATRADSGKIWLRMQGRRLWAGLSHGVVGYGHRPERALFWVLGFWLLGSLLYFIAYRAGLMVPNSDVIMVSAEWLEAVKADRLAPTALWTGDAVRASAHYETFFAGIYALDLFLPVVDLGQEKTWAVTTPTIFGCGWWLRLASFVYQIAGWVVISMGLAAVTGFVQRNDPE